MLFRSQDSGQARIKVFVKPMILWLWIGTFVMVAGTALAIVPRRRRNRENDMSSAAGHSQESTVSA